MTAAWTFANLALPQVSDHNTVLMLVLAGFGEAPGCGGGVLSAKGSRVILQRPGSEIQFDRGWEDWTEIAETRPAVARRVRRGLPQPLW
ncbi:hypothetical protein EV385_4118 [Krasilnikovia cinnamomea]|uniref:Uncharacterized protein n=1 Tax=Krasilnikovia cinnamomea TaxID=349313 RepID=A0A4Q7ZMN7_9ACTN|nr:hypothetical protein [Krasilnikovia cinnamomea]RZU52270.1 hypothetical protein EV385_4118 [Krasilnikovia cinnamomea]